MHDFILDWEMPVLFEYLSIILFIRMILVGLPYKNIYFWASLAAFIWQNADDLYKHEIMITIIKNIFIIYKIM